MDVFHICMGAGVDDGDKARRRHLPSCRAKGGGIEDMSGV